VKAVWIRGVVYAVLAVVLAQLSMLEAQHFAAVSRFSEFGYVEFGQSLLLLSCAVMLFIADRRGDGDTPLLGCMALGFLILLIRENDQVLELWFPHGVWKWLALLVLIPLVLLFWRNRHRVLDEVKEMARTPAFGVLLAGFSTLVFSRFFGRGDFWTAVMEERYWRPVKNAAEEGVELFALGLLTAGVVELVLHQRSLNERAAP
jgi:hypothetical protein